MNILSKPLLTGLILSSIFACKPGVDPKDPIPEDTGFTPADGPELVQFQSCEETKSYLAEVVINQALSYRYGYYGWGIMGAEDAETDASPESSGDAPSDYTTTNVQEAGVDEIDLVKTDGQYLYIAQDQALHIVDSWPVEESHKVSTIALDGWSYGLFLHGDKVVVASSNYDSQRYSGTRFTIIDVTDRANPVVERTIDIEGYQADARMVGSDMYFVLNHWLELPYEIWDMIYDDNLGLPEVNWNLEGAALEADMDTKREEAREILAPFVEEMVQGWDVNELLPQWRDSAGSGQFETMLSCDDIYRPGQVAQYNMLSLFHLDIDTDETSSTGLMSNGWTVYASQENLYVAQTSRWWWWGWGSFDLDTHIHKFELNPDSNPEYAGSGAVDGWIYDQFALSEYDGYLRVASTSVDWWGWGAIDEDEEEAGNNITILHDGDDGTLDEVGSITGIAPGEQIRACRMMGSKGYVVTFEQTDPLFTIDLHDPRNPQVIGELHIPGFSTYLHPVGDDYLLSVGMAGLDDGTLTGMAVNIFDVSDFENPEWQYQYEITDEDAGWSWSEALWEHHAFTYHRNVLSIPAYRYSYTVDENGYYDYDYFSGTLSFDIDVESNTGIELIGEVDHRDLVEESECLYTLYYDYDEAVCDDWGWYANVRRNVYIEDNLFSISNYGVRVTDLNDPSSSIANVLFYPEN
jgi:uncharacterized secreted protein with C-terminal beta-propeller domain